MMMHRLNVEVRKIMAFARREAVRRGEAKIGTHHVLLGAMARSHAARSLLGRFGKTPKEIAAAIDVLRPPTTVRRSLLEVGAMPLTQAAGAAWATAGEVAALFRSEEVTAVELLAALVLQRYGVAARVLTEDWARVPEEILRCICDAAGWAGDRGTLEWLMKSWERAERSED